MTKSSRVEDEQDRGMNTTKQAGATQTAKGGKLKERRATRPNKLEQRKQQKEASSRNEEQMTKSSRVEDEQDRGMK